MKAVILDSRTYATLYSNSNFAFISEISNPEFIWNVVICTGKLLVIVCFEKFTQFLYARLKNGTYYVTGYGVRLSVNFFISG